MQMLKKESRKTAFLTSSHLMPKLPVCGPHFKEQEPTAVVFNPGYTPKILMSGKV